MTLALSWGIQASHETPLPIHPVSFETPYTAALSRLLCTTKGKMFCSKDFHFLFSLNSATLSPKSTSSSLFAIT